MYWVNIVMFTAFLGFAIQKRRFALINLFLLFLAIHVSGRVLLLRYWNLVSGFIMYSLISFAVPQMRKQQNWFRMGTIDKKSGVYLLVTIVLSSAVLIFWYFTAKPDLSAMTEALISHSVAVKIAAVIIFALINAVTEECIFDGVLFHASEKAFRSPAVVILISAVSYSIVHYYGIPNGFSGVLLSFIYGGLMLGVLRYLTGGILMPILAHIAADVTIALLAFGFIS